MNKNNIWKITELVKKYKYALIGFIFSQVLMQILMIQAYFPLHYKSTNFIDYYFRNLDYHISFVNVFLSITFTFLGLANDLKKNRFLKIVTFAIYLIIAFGLIYLNSFVQTIA